MQKILTTHLVVQKKIEERFNTRNIRKILSSKKLQRHSYQKNNVGSI